MTDTLEADVDREELDLLLRGFQVSRILRLVADLGLADKIPRNGHLMVQSLAAACAVSPEPLLRVLRVLAALRIFKVHSGRLRRTYTAFAPAANGHAE